MNSNGPRTVITSFLGRLVRLGGARWGMVLALVAIVIGGTAGFYFLVTVPTRNRAERAAVEALNARGFLVLVMPGEVHAETANLMSTTVDGESMQLLGQLTQLRQLILNDCGLTDELIAPIAGLGLLHSLSATRNNLTPAGIKHLANLRGLETLTLRYNPSLGNDGLKIIGRLRQLRVLDVSGCGITDDGLVHLERLTKLEHLLLARNDISDNGMQHLAKLPALIRVHLGDTDVTPKGLAALQAANPRVSIEVSPVPEPAGAAEGTTAVEEPAAEPAPGPGLDESS